MDWYNSFNTVEALLWFAVAIVIAVRVPTQTRQKRFGAGLASASFLVFGVTDLLEVGRAGHLPLWLWGLKIACGVGIFVSRYTWLGWNRFRWRDREFLFGLGCLVAVLVVIVLERWLE